MIDRSGCSAAIRPKGDRVGSPTKDPSKTQVRRLTDEGRLRYVGSPTKGARTSVYRYMMGSREPGWEESLKTWEAELNDPDQGQDSAPDADFDFESVTPAIAEEELATWIVDMKHKGALSAKDACVACWWAHKAGVAGRVGDLALRPGKQSSAYSRHFDKVVDPGKGSADDDLYVVRAPAYHRATDSRVGVDLHVLPPLEAADEEIRGTQGIRAKLARMVLDNYLPPAYTEHEVVRKAPPGVPVYPYALYIDAVKFQRTGAVIGIWLCSLVTGLRQLCVALRKSEMCSCGCGGWCTMYCIMAMLNWSFAHMARGLAPSARHDASPWTAADCGREAVSGIALGWLAVVLFIKSDMMEYVTSFGFPSWATAAHPCPLCFCKHEDWGRIAGINNVDLPWKLKTFADYKRACDDCEIWVAIRSADMFRRVRASLSYDRKPSGSRGRALQVDIPVLGLRKGDRLQPGGDIWDVGQIDIMDPQSACRLLFWRRSAETHVRQRNPLFSEETGIVPERVLVVDWLHTLSLGVYKYFISVLWHTLIEHDAFKVGPCTAGERSLLSTGRLRNELFAWYDQELAAGRVHSRVQNLTPEMIGTSVRHKLGTWGAETNGLLLFSRSLLQVHRKALHPSLARSLTKGLEALIGIHTIIKEHTGGHCPVYVAQRFADHVKVHMHAMRALEIPVHAKHHALAHMVHKLLRFGTPALWGCWRDESDNKMLAQLALRAHRTVWSRRLISEHRMAFGTRRAQRPRR